MKDPEVGEVNRADDNKATITHKVKGKWTAKKMLAGAALAFGLVVLVFGIGLFASHCGMAAPLPFFSLPSNGIN